MKKFYKIVLATTVLFAGVSPVLPFSSEEVYAQPPISYEPIWETINSAYYTPAEVQQMASEIRSVQSVGQISGVLSAWLWKFPALAGSVATLGYLLSQYQSTIVSIADSGSGLTIEQQENVNPYKVDYNNTIRLVVYPS